MGTEPLDRLERLFQAAKMRPPEERAAFLDAACGDDPALRQEVESLLEAYEDAEADDFLKDTSDGPVDAILGEMAYADDRSEGKRIGPYTVLHRLGRGGMGDVYLAARQRPFKRRVALKVIRQEMATKDAFVRFALERQILASLNHPNIASLYDGGVTDEGQPYLAMEFVDGQPITQYCDKHRLTIPERLLLFKRVCEAVHYAHQNLIIHRDLKPSNIYVTDDGTVKLLDFGIAKLLNPNLSPTPLPVTRAGLHVMTSEYASPEQVRGDALTTASDVYALGVLLYELLTGHRPYELAGRPAPEIIAAVCDLEPERPSTRVARTERIAGPGGRKIIISPETVAAARGVSVERLRRVIRGDLDTIALTALRKEPARRYRSAEQLAHDVDRYLTGRPVSAYPDSVWYRVRKFATRHRAVVLSTVLVLLSLIGGFGTALWQAHEARQERDRAEEALARSETVTNFLTNLFEASDPQQTQGMDVTARELIERGVARVEALQEQPELQAHLLTVVGQVYVNLGQYAAAETLATRAMGLRRASLGHDHVRVTESMTDLAAILTRQGRYAEAEVLLRRALSIQQQQLEAAHPAHIAALQILGHLLPYLGKMEEAVEVRRQVVMLRRSALGDDDPLVANAMVSLGAVLRAEGEYDEAEQLFREAMSIHRRARSQPAAGSTNSQFQLALLLKHRGAYDEAEALLRQAVDLRRRTEGDMDPEVASYLLELGEILHLQGEIDTAERNLREAIRLRWQVLGDHPNTSGALATLASFLYARGAVEEADSLYGEALNMQLRQLGPNHPSVASVMRSWSHMLLDHNQFERADSLLRRAYHIHREANGPDHYHVGQTLLDLATLHERRGDLAQAARLYQDALVIIQNRRGAGHPEVLDIVRHLERVHDLSGSPEEAARYRAMLDPVPKQL